VVRGACGVPAAAALQLTFRAGSPWSCVSWRRTVVARSPRRSDGRRTGERHHATATRGGRRAADHARRRIATVPGPDPQRWGRACGRRCRHHRGGTRTRPRAGGTATGTGRRVRRRPGPDRDQRCPEPGVVRPEAVGSAGAAPVPPVGAAPPRPVDAGTAGRGRRLVRHRCPRRVAGVVRVRGPGGRCCLRRRRGVRRGGVRGGGLRRLPGDAPHGDRLHRVDVPVLGPVAPPAIERAAEARARLDDRWLVRPDREPVDPERRRLPGGGPPRRRRATRWPRSRRSSTGGGGPGSPAASRRTWPPSPT
jgi:hypothetical protein